MLRGMWHHPDTSRYKTDQQTARLSATYTVMSKQTLINRIVIWHTDSAGKQTLINSKIMCHTDTDGKQTSINSMIIWQHMHSEVHYY